MFVPEIADHHRGENFIGSLNALGAIIADTLASAI
jgi:hypothetical protein